ncbi:uncharacterized protein [Diabrotica undecimpunctata]|uniref:uncharacterized protein isoform X3 n=1 Tax=Diabrotica undecimpunctata TaxID=50387 RepID=UPI003B639AFE
MESNIEINEEFVESGQRHIENQLSTSTDCEDLKSGPEANSARAVETEIKEEFVEGNPRYVESQVSTSLDLRDLKNELDDYNSDRTVKAEINEEFVEDNPRYIESQLSTSLDLWDFKNEDTSERGTISNIASENESDELTVVEENQNEEESSREQESSTQLETGESSQLSQPENQVKTFKSPSAHKSRRSKVSHSETIESSSTALMKYIISKNEQPTTTNAIDAFLNGISETYKMFPPVYQHMAKTKIFNIVSEIELQLLTPVRPHQQSSAYDWYQQPGTSTQNHNYVDMGVASPLLLQQQFPGITSHYQQLSSATTDSCLSSCTSSHTENVE